MTRPFVRPASALDTAHIGDTIQVYVNRRLANRSPREPFTRQLVSAELVAVNRRTVHVRLSSGKIVKRKIGRDVPREQ